MHGCAAVPRLQKAVSTAAAVASAVVGVAGWVAGTATDRSAPLPHAQQPPLAPQLRQHAGRHSCRCVPAIAQPRAATLSHSSISFSKPTAATPFANAVLVPLPQPSHFASCQVAPSAAPAIAIPFRQLIAAILCCTVSPWPPIHQSSAANPSINVPHASLCDAAPSEPIPATNHQRQSIWGARRRLRCLPRLTTGHAARRQSKR